MTRSRIGAKLDRLADKLIDLRKLTKLDDKLMDLRAWGMPGSDLRGCPDRRQIAQITQQNK